ncbi:hypothetical protein ACFWSF_37235 [Streptomyces sp. NPDC058611]|uniref:hypothetical protein n=1 Tax=unclassified Streptomyces TaxID=2593676 RepID=UPI00366081BB
MKKIITATTLALAGVGLTAPAHADTASDLGSAVNAANNWNFTAAAVCLQEVAVVPVLGDWAWSGSSACRAEPGAGGR